MKSYLFLLAWVEGSDSASGEKTKVHSHKDLYPQYNKGNEHIFALVITAPNEKIAYLAGYAEAFHENYTGCDSTSTVLVIDGKKVKEKENTVQVEVHCKPD